MKHSLDKVRLRIEFNLHLKDYTDLFIILYISVKFHGDLKYFFFVAALVS